MKVKINKNNITNGDIIYFNKPQKVYIPLISGNDTDITVLVKKGQFESGGVGIYFEIDSKVPEKERFEFLAAKHYKIKTQKYRNSDGSQFWSQGLLMHPNDFEWEVQVEPVGGKRTEVVIDNEGKPHYPDDESRFLTTALGVTYAVEEDNKRKSNSTDKYKRMAQRNGKLFSHQPFRWLMKCTWGKKLLFIFFGKKRDKKSGWPSWVKKTDEERIQNMPWILNNKEPWIATEKIDGTSTTFTIKRKPFGRYDFFVCSRNVVFDKPDKKCFYETNVYTEMAEKYNIEAHMKEMKQIHEYYDKTYGLNNKQKKAINKRYKFLEKAWKLNNKK